MPFPLKRRAKREERSSNLYDRFSYTFFSLKDYSLVSELLTSYKSEIDHRFIAGQKSILNADLIGGIMKVLVLFHFLTLLFFIVVFLLTPLLEFLGNMFSVYICFHLLRGSFFITVVASDHYLYVQDNYFFFLLSF